MMNTDIIVKVCFNPGLSYNTMKLIEETMEPSMVSPDGDCRQYEIHDTLQLCNITNQRDLDYLKYLQNVLKVEYIELS